MEDILKEFVEKINNEEISNKEIYELGKNLAEAIEDRALVKLFIKGLKKGNSLSGELEDVLI